MQLRIYKFQAEMPVEYAWQIRTFIRVVWGGTEDDYDTDAPLIPADLNPVFFVLAEEHALVSYGRLIWMRVNHMGESHKLYGLGDVYTFPASRGRGYGGQIVRAATDYILADSEADAGLLLTEPSLSSFYGRYGWSHVPNPSVTTGECDHPERRDDFLMMRFVSQRACQRREDFETKPIFLPGDEW